MSSATCLLCVEAKRSVRTRAIALLIMTAAFRPVFFSVFADPNASTSWATVRVMDAWSCRGRSCANSWMASFTDAVEAGGESTT